MARKKQEIQLQQEVESQEEWEEMMAKEGLWVVDIYQDWCGPCSAMVSNFRRLKNELGDDLLHFAIAKVDTIDALEKYKGRCEPTFLFFACGVLVSVVHGSKSPMIIRTITEQLAQEHKVVDGTAERKEIKDPLLAQLEDKDKGSVDDEEEERDEENTGFTVAIIKPDAVRNGKVDEILEQMQEKGIEVMTQVERQLTEDEAREFYSHLKDEEYFEELIEFMSSGPSHVLVLTKGSSSDDILTEWRDMIGPTSVEEAKEQNPDSLRAKYGSGSVMNALHGSSSPETAAREMAFFFPNLSTSKKSKSAHVERTLALIRPDAFRLRKDEILDKIREAGFKVALQKTMTLTKEQAADFYKEHEGQPYFDDLVTRMSSGPLMALGLARADAVQGWREMLGPKEVNKAKEEAPESLRAQFSVDDVEINQLHGSDSSTAAQKELDFFFPMEQTVACIKPDAIGTKDAIIDKIHEAGFRIAAQKETHITKDIAEDFYSEHKDKDYFNDLVEHMTSGPTMFMVLSKEDAVSGWREAIGPTDPQQAKEEIPDSIRAMFGSDILKNAVHGSSNPDHAKKSIEQVFGHLDFNADDNSPLQEEEEEQAQRQSPVEQVSETAPEYKPSETAESKPEEQKDSDAASQKDTTEDKSEDKNQSQQEPDEKTKSQTADEKPADSEQVEREKSPEGRKSADSNKSGDSQTDKKDKKETGSVKEQVDTKSVDGDSKPATDETTKTEDTPTPQLDETNTDKTAENGNEQKPDSETKEQTNGEENTESTEKKEEEGGVEEGDKTEEKPEEKTEEKTEEPKTE